MVAAIEEGKEPSLGDRRARRRDDLLEPPRTPRAAGLGRAGENYRPVGAYSRGQSGDRLSERVDDDDRIARLCRQSSPAKYAETSTIRLEKPHSLSYQARTRTKRLSST